MEGSMGNYRDEFEEFLKGKADQHKMYPSDKVWNSINRKLHPRRKWYLAGILLLLTGLGYYTAQEVLNSDADLIANPGTPENQPDLSVISRPDNNSSVIKQDFSEEVDVIHSVENSLFSNSSEILNFENSTAKIIPLYPAEKLREFNNDKPVISSPSAGKVSENKEENIEERISALHAPIYLNEEMLDKQRAEVMAEQALYQFDYKKPSRFSIQYSFSPIVSYRIFSGTDNAKLNTNINTIPNALNIPGKADKLVNHIPAPGIELGTTLLYHITPKLALKSGIQFNYSRYDINAYSTSGEIATISLTNNSGFSTRSLYGYSRHSNFGGNHTEVLQNSYFQLSVPIGVELTVLGNERVQLGVAGSLQPAYLLNKNSYLISTDYKNYTQNPNLLKSWNLNSNAEIFAAFQTPTVRWQIGPQVRYQVISGFKKEYPIKQHLIEYGIKIGVSKGVNKK